MVIFMFDNIEKIKIASVLRRVSKPSAHVPGRNAHGLNIRVSGENQYTFSDKQVTVKAGEVIFIPKGTVYHYKTTEGSICTTINIECDFNIAHPVVFSLKDFGELDFLCNRFADLWKFGTIGDKCECISKFYSLLSFMANSESATCPEKMKFELIEPAVEYLKTHIFSTNLKTEKLHEFCGISNTYFRELFYLRFKATSKEYIISIRISHAKSIIDSGDFTSVNELAHSVGYRDALYFSKAFKKVYGASPSVTNRLTANRQ